MTAGVNLSASLGCLTHSGLPVHLLFLGPVSRAPLSTWPSSGRGSPGLFSTGPRLRHDIRDVTDRHRHSELPLSLLPELDSAETLENRVH